MLKFYPNKELGFPRLKSYQLADGICIFWAFIFAKIYGGEIVEIFPMGDLFMSLLRNGYYHAMVLRQGKYYDANHPQGLDKPITPEGYTLQAITRSVSSFEKMLESKPVLKKHVFSVLSKIGTVINLDKTN